MARQSRLDAAGVLHHVIVRGIERRRIFLDDRDREDFLNRWGAIFPETKTSCDAFALLPNHVHLLLRTGTVPLSTIMARLLTGYAVHFNRVHRRHGHLFQNRDKSIVCQEDAYLKELTSQSREGTDIEALASYPYSGHTALIGKRKDLLGGGLLRSHGGWAEIIKSPERLKGDVRILGDSDFVLDIRSRAEQKLDHRYRLKTMGVDFSFVER
jgi:putative transposase